MKTKFAYSVTYTIFDDTVNANRQHGIWIRGKNGQRLTDKDINKLLKNIYKNANVIKSQQWIDQR